VHPPDQPLKVDPAVAAAVNVTMLFWLKLAAQVTPQLIPAGVLVTVPAPAPALVTVNWTGIGVKLAVTVFAALMVTAQVVAVPVQPPVQLLNVEPAVAAAVKVTTLFWLKLATQVAPQLMPAGALVTVPNPVPTLVTVSATGMGAKVAVTVLVTFIVTAQVGAVPVHPPDQAVSLEPAAAEAVNVTVLFWLKLAAQVAPQLIPAGALVTVPTPVPALVTVSATGIGAKVAVTVLATFMVTVQGFTVPVHPPVQALNLEPATAVAVSLTALFWLKLAAQVAPQLTPAGVLTTVPAPVPALVTVSFIGIGKKLAVTVFARLITTVQVVVAPVQAPVQALNFEPDAAVAVNLTLVFVVKLKLQVTPQLIPAGVLTTVPAPVPVLVTVSLTVAAWASVGASNPAKIEKITIRLIFAVGFMFGSPYCGNTWFCRRESAS
jgi:hypothetical protein